MLLYITVYHLIFHAVLLLNNVFLIIPILYIYIFIHIYMYIYIYMVFKTSLCDIQSLYLTTSHYFLHYAALCILFYIYFILLLCIITFNIDYCHVVMYYCILQAMYGPSLLNYCLLSIGNIKFFGIRRSEQF